MISEIQCHLLALQDKKYQEFQSKICTTSSKPIIGVRVPQLRKYCRQLLAQKNEVLFFDEYYEEILLHAFYIGGLKTDYKTKVKLIDEFIPLIDNWAVCDGLVSSLKFIKKHKKEYYPHLKKYLKSNKEYYQRYGLVVLLSYYVQEEYLEDIYSILIHTKYNGYYSLMAGAWLLSYCFMYDFDRTLQFIQNNKLNEFVYKKGIQKCLDSYQISNTNKKLLKSLPKQP